MPRVSLYYLNARFVFYEKPRIKKAIQYPVVYLVQYLVSLWLLYVLVEIFGTNKLVTPALVIVLTLPATYLMSRLIIKESMR